MIPFCQYKRTVTRKYYKPRQPRTIQRAPVGSLAAKITEHRQKLKLTQIQAAKLIGISTVVLSDWECGWKEPNESYRDRIQRFLDRP